MYIFHCFCQCFSCGVEAGSHKAEHGYQIDVCRLTASFLKLLKLGLSKKSQLRILILTQSICTLFSGYRTFPVLFINSSRLSSLAEPGLGAPLSSYLEGALYKLIYR